MSTKNITKLSKQELVAKIIEKHAVNNESIILITAKAADGLSTISNVHLFVEGTFANKWLKVKAIKESEAEMMEFKNPEDIDGILCYDIVD